MLFPFVTVASKGGPHDDGAYVAGWEMGRLDADLALLAGAMATSAERTIHTENLPQADLVAMYHGFTCTAEPSEVEGWTYITLQRAEITAIDDPTGDQP